MDEKDNDIKQAIDSIFGDDILEIESNDNSLKNDNNGTDINLKTSTFNSTNTIEKKDDTKQSSIKDSVTINQEDKILLTSNNVSKETSLTTVNKEENDYSKSIDTLIVNQEEKKEKTSFNKNIIFYFIIGFVIGLILIYIIVGTVSGKQKVVNCSYNAEDTGYKVTDEYKIKYKNDSILYVEYLYNYIAKTDEYKSQIEYVKEEKIPVIINSNGMSGFTYIYETGDTFFKVNGYLDFTLFDYEKIKKLNQKVTPISYFNIDPNPSFKALQKNLEKNGYECTSSK